LAEKHVNRHSNVVFIIEMKFLTSFYFLVCLVFFVNAIPKDGNKAGGAENEIENETETGGNQGGRNRGGGGNRNGTQAAGGGRRRGGRAANQTATLLPGNATNSTRGRKQKGKNRNKTRIPAATPTIA
jgi:hypothetical protein